MFKRFAVSCIAVFSLCAGEASACSRSGGWPTDAQLFDAAEQVFFARVVSTKLTKLPRCEGEEVEQCEVVTGRFELVRSIKGKTRKRGTVTDMVPGIGTCALGLSAGWHYVFYVGPDHNWVTWSGGSFALGAYLQAEQVEEILKTLEQPGHRRPTGNEYE